MYTVHIRSEYPEFRGQEFHSQKELHLGCLHIRWRWEGFTPSIYVLQIISQVLRDYRIRSRLDMAHRIRFRGKHSPRKTQPGITCTSQILQLLEESDRCQSNKAEG